MKTDTTIPPPPEVSSTESSAVGLPAQTGGGSSRLIDLVGKRFGRLIVISRVEGSSQWKVKCDCGKTHVAGGGHLRSGATTSCGCYRREQTSLRCLDDLTGKRFGRLAILSRAGNTPNGRTTWTAKCDCGKEHIVQGDSLRSGSTTSCGCYRRERISIRRLDNLIGQRFGRLVVVSRAANTCRGETRWNAKCDCGAQRVVWGSSLRSGATTSCGCYSHEQTSLRCLNSLIGQRFGRLVVLTRAKNTRSGSICWKVKCDCGKVLTVQGNNLCSGNTISCGCFHRDKMSTLYGTKSPTWDPTLTQEDRDRQRRGTPTQAAMAAVANQIRRRDRATCLVCGAPRSTHVHHLESWALNRNLRYSPANLVTLCKECHDQFHYLYGGKDAGLDEFEEYLKP